MKNFLKNVFNAKDKSENESSPSQMKNAGSTASPIRPVRPISPISRGSEDESLSRSIKNAGPIASPSPGGDLSRLGSGERNMGEAIGRLATERAGASESARGEGEQPSAKGADPSILAALTSSQHDSRVLTGKIARLPKIIREKLNRRLDDNQPASEILPWLNAFPAVQRILAAQFNGAPINEQNLSNWRASGFQRWLERQQPLADLKYLSEDAGDFSRTTRGRLARGAASIVAARLLKRLESIPLENCSISDITNISYAIAALYHADQSHVRLRHDKKRVRIRDEQLTLSWDKHQRDTAEIALRVLDDAQARAIRAKPVSHKEKIEMIGRCIYGKHWRGKHISGPAKS